MDIGPGDALTSLFDVDAEYGFISVRANGVYYVRELVDTLGDAPCSRCGGVGGKGIILQGDRPTLDSSGWCPCTFRPYHGPEVEREEFFSRDRRKIGRFEFYRLSVISGIQPK